MNTFSEVEQWAAVKLDAYRKMNDGDLTEIETAKLRGRIAALKELLALQDLQKVLQAQSKSDLPE